MSPQQFFLYLFLALSSTVKAQIGAGIIGKEFISKQGAYLKLINDSQLISSITSYEDTNSYQIRNDSLLTSKKFWITDRDGSRETIAVERFKILALKRDTVVLENRYLYDYKPYDWIDTVVFVDLQKAKRPVVDFQLIVFRSWGAWDGSRVVQIDKTGIVTYLHEPPIYSINNPGVDPKAKPTRLKGKLSTRDFGVFMELLTRAMIVPPVIQDCQVMDYSSLFSITVGDKNYTTNSCGQNRLHNELINYLLNLDKGKRLPKLK